MKSLCWIIILCLFTTIPALAAGQGTRFVLEVATSGKPSVDRELVRRSLEVLKNRLETVGEPNATLEQQGVRRIIVGIARFGKDAEEAITQVTRTSRLEFRLVVENANPDKPPADAEVLYDVTFNETTNKIEGQPFVVKKKPLLSGDILADAAIGLDSFTNRPYIDLKFNENGSKLLEKATASIIGKRIAMAVDKNIISAAVVRDAIRGGRMQLTGNFTMEMAQDFATALGSNYLPATIRIVSRTNDLPAPAAKQEPAAPPRADVDRAIPRGPKGEPYDVAVVIGNRNYSASGSPDVEYAANDARTMREYLVSALGFDPANIIFLEDATLTRLNEVFGTRDDHRGKLFKWVKPGLSRVFVYYVGHGAPDQETGEAYFVPVDANPQYITTSGYKLSTFYANLAKLPAARKTVVIDACFSGSSPKGALFKGVSGLMARLKAEPGAPGAADLLLTSTGTNQVAGWYPEKGHSLFTYFFLKGLQGEADTDKNGTITMGEMRAYLNDKVPYMARRLTGNEQQPVMTGPDNDVLITFKK